MITISEMAATVNKIGSLNAILDEYFASDKYPPFNSPHEGYAVLLEEVDELWDEVKRYKNDGDQKILSAMKKEAAQVGAMAMKFLLMINELEQGAGSGK